MCELAWWILTKCEGLEDDFISEPLKETSAIVITQLHNDAFLINKENLICASDLLEYYTKNTLVLLNRSIDTDNTLHEILIKLIIE